MLAIVTDAIYPYHIGGKEVRYHHLVAGLAGAGFEVHVFTMNWWHGSRHKVEGGVHYHALCREYPLYTNTRRSILEAVMFSIACLRLVFYRFDLVEADHMPHLQLVTVRLVTWLRRAPLVVTWHEVWGREYWRSYLGPLGVVAAAIESATIRLGEQLVAASRETGERLAAAGVAPERLRVVPNGVDLEQIAASPAASMHSDLLFAGRLLEHKHVDQLVECVALLRERGRVVSCAIVGEGPERSRLEEQVARLGLADQVTFLGNLADQTELFGLMKSAKLFVLPSTREGFGLALVEAIACDLPVVTTDHLDNHARALVEPGVTGLLCAPSATALAETVAIGLRDEFPRPLLAEDNLKRFGWPASVEGLLETFARAGIAPQRETS